MDAGRYAVGKWLTVEPDTEDMAVWDTRKEAEQYATKDQGEFGTHIVAQIVMVQPAKEVHSGYCYHCHTQLEGTEALAAHYKVCPETLKLQQQGVLTMGDLPPL